MPKKKNEDFGFSDDTGTGGHTYTKPPLSEPKDNLSEPDLENVYNNYTGGGSEGLESGFENDQSFEGDPFAPGHSGGSASGDDLSEHGHGDNTTGGSTSDDDEEETIIDDDEEKSGWLSSYKEYLKELEKLRRKKETLYNQQQADTKARTSLAGIMSEHNKYLYETGLQNIFNDYQQSIETLSQQKQREIQDAYYIREMSKKYLGKYASNIGIGDVSGDLLDIYGNYHRNLSDIRQHYGDLKMGLEQEYNQQRVQMTAEYMDRKFQIQLQELNTKEQGILFDAITGNFDPSMTQHEFLALQFEEGVLTSETYYASAMALYEQNEQMVMDYLASGHTGNFETTQEFLDSWKDQITPLAYDRLSVYASTQDFIRQNSQLHNIMDPDSEHYIGDNYDINLYTIDAKVGPGSIGFTDGMGNRFFSSLEAYDQDSYYMPNQDPWQVYEQYHNRDPENYSSHPSHGDIITMQATHIEHENTQSVDYYFDGVTWRRLVQEINPEEFTAQMSNWYIPEEHLDEKGWVSPSGSNFSMTSYTQASFIRVNPQTGQVYGDFYSETPTITMNNVTYGIDTAKRNMEGTNMYMYDIQNPEMDVLPLNSPWPHVLELFRNTHGIGQDDFRNNSFVLYNGRMYYHENGKIYEMDRVEG